MCFNKRKQRLHKLFKLCFSWNAHYIDFLISLKLGKKINLKKNRANQAALHNNQKYFWKFIKSRQKTENISCNTTNGNTTVNIIEYAVNLFKFYFEFVYSPWNSNISHIRDLNTKINLNICFFFVAETFESLGTLSRVTKSVPDQIPDIIYSGCIYTLPHIAH